MRCLLPGSHKTGHLKSEPFGIVLKASEAAYKNPATGQDLSPGAEGSASLIPRCYPSTAVGNCPRLLRSSLHCPTGSRSSMSPSPRPGQQLPCIKPPGSVDGLGWLCWGAGVAVLWAGVAVRALPLLAVPSVAHGPPPWICSCQSLTSSCIFRAESESRLLWGGLMWLPGHSPGVGE